MNRPANAYPKVSVVTLNWNGRDDTLECIASLKQMTYPNFDIAVADNGSSDGSVPAFHEHHPDIAVVENGSNLGYARGFNAGLQYAYDHGAAYMLILNNDTAVSPDLLDALVSTAETDPCIGFVSGKVYFYDEPNRLQTAGRLNHPIWLVHELVGSGEIDNGQYDQVKEYDFLDDIFLLVRREAYEATGGYDPNFFLYYEETDWCVRVRRAGFKLVYTPHARIWHKHGKSTGGDKGPKFMYYMTRNQIVFMRRSASREAFGRYVCYLIVHSPRRAAQLLKHRRFDLFSAYVRGLGSGAVWAWRNRVSANSTIRSTP